MLLCSYLLLTKTHLYGLIERPNKKKGMAEISVRLPLNSIIKIATKSSCPEMISFTYGDKEIKAKASSNGSLQTASASVAVANESVAKIENESETEGSTSSTSKKETKTTTNSSSTSNNNTNTEPGNANDDVNVDYIIKGKEWFFVSDYAGEAASAVKMQILQLANLVTQ